MVAARPNAYHRRSRLPTRHRSARRHRSTSPQRSTLTRACRHRRQRPARLPHASAKRPAGNPQQLPRPTHHRRPLRRVLAQALRPHSISAQTRCRHLPKSTRHSAKPQPQTRRFNRQQPDRQPLSADNRRLHHRHR